MWFHNIKIINFIKLENPMKQSTMIEFLVKKKVIGQI